MSFHKFTHGPNVHVFFIETSDFFAITLETSSQFCATIPEKYESTWAPYLDSYGQKRPIPLCFLPRHFLPPFHQKVLLSLSSTLFGSTLSYSELASMAGSPKSARATGQACHRNPYPLLIPCHRVISKNGSLGGYAFGSCIKKILLEFEQ